MHSLLIRVLMIEDSTADATYVKRCLSRAEDEVFDVAHVTRLGDGVERLAEERFDIILLDLNLPDSGGVDTINRACAGAQGTPIVLMTSIEDERLARQALRGGVQDYIAKRKIDTELLVRAIRYAIERKRAFQELEESRERYALAVQGANDGIWDWDLRTGEMYFSPRWKAMLGYEEDELADDPDEWIQRIHPDDRRKVLQEIEAHRDGKTSHFENEHLVKHKDGTYRWMLCRGVAIKTPEGKAYRMAGSHTDVTERKSAELKLRHDALHDTLTDLPNRALLWDRLLQVIARQRRYPELRYAVLFIDLDRFKIVNDSLGHLVGDLLLVEVSHRLGTFLRTTDTLARLGGDEFVILMENISDLRDATRVAERVLRELEKPFRIGEHEVTTTASIGIAWSDPPYDAPEHLLRDADTAMYRAKARGRSCYEIFDQEMHNQVSTLMKMESDLRRAIEREEFIIHYQPIISLSSGRLTGFEALVRWRHPERGVIHPLEFIELAEETGLIVPLGNWVLREACRQLREWKDRWPAIQDLYVTVNLSNRQIRQPDFPAVLRSVLDETGVDPSSLKLEITESMIMESEDVVLQTFQELKGLGIRLLIDDFGTGYSSLGYLHRFPIDNLKIDRSFVSGLCGEDGNMEIVRTIITLASNLHLQVIAEGVETSAQLDRLREIHVGEAQGFYFSKPLDSESAGTMLVAAPSS